MESRSEYSIKDEQGTKNKEQRTSNNDPLIDSAIISFQHNLEKLRQLVPVKNICMHGSPRSKYDNRDLWKKYNYRDFGIIGEPYFDMDFDDVFYLTDTGRRWDGWKVSVRDKVPQQERWVGEGLVFRSTHDIIRAIETAKGARDLSGSTRLTTQSRLTSNDLSLAPLAVPTSDFPTSASASWLTQQIHSVFNNFAHQRVRSIKILFPKRMWFNSAIDTPTDTH